MIFDFGVQFVGLTKTMISDFNKSWSENFSIHRNFISKLLDPFGRSGGLLLGTDGEK